MARPNVHPSHRTTLRAATTSGHARVDAFFRGGMRDARDYRTYLRGLHGLLRGATRALERAPLSPAWRAWPQAPRVAWLEADLAAHGLAALPRAPDPRIEGDADAAGLLYVIEGSALGARLLVRDARAFGWRDGRGATFLHRHAGDDAAARWAAFVACLEAADFDAADEGAMRAAAVAAFACAEQEFRRARTQEE